MENSHNIYVETPLWERNIKGKRVYYKMETFQPTGSFKCRGIGNLCRYYVEEESLKHIVCASGGNAGLAAAYSARKLGVKATVVVPENTLQCFKDRIQGEGAFLIEHGVDFDVSSDLAKEIALKENGGFVSPYDHPKIWEGNGTVMEEVYFQIGKKKPGAVVVSVGGGGLIIGIVEMLDRLGWSDVPVYGVETAGCASMHAAFTANEWVSLPYIDTVAKSLGAKRIAKHLFNISQTRKIESIVVSDAEAVHACKRFLNEERILVEPACGTALAAYYENKANLSELNDVVIITCGGVGISFEQLHLWLESFAVK